MCGWVSSGQLNGMHMCPVVKDLCTLRFTLLVLILGFSKVISVQTCALVLTEIIITICVLTLRYLVVTKHSVVYHIALHVKQVMNVLCPQYEMCEYFCQCIPVVNIHISHSHLMVCGPFFIHAQVLLFDIFIMQEWLVKMNQLMLYWEGHQTT